MRHNAAKSRGTLHDESFNTHLTVAIRSIFLWMERKEARAEAEVCRNRADFPLLRFRAWNESSWRRVRDLISLKGGFCQVGEPKLMQLNVWVSSFCQEVVFLGGEEEREWTSGSDAPLSTSVWIHSRLPSYRSAVISSSPSCVSHFPLVVLQYEVQR